MLPSSFYYPPKYFEREIKEEKRAKKTQTRHVASTGGN